MRLNGLGVAMYLLLSSWLLLASVVRLMIQVVSGNVDWLPFVGIALGLLALAGIGFGRVTEPADEQRPTGASAERRPASPGAVARPSSAERADGLAPSGSTGPGARAAADPFGRQR